MPNYQNGKIYCIRSFKTDDIYIGSTTRRLCERIAEHKRNYKKWIKQKKKYYTSFEIINYGDAYIELLKLYPCSCKEELKKEEGKYQREIECVNKRVDGGRTYEEIKQYFIDYRNKTKEKMKEYNKEYREKNKIEISKIKKQKFICECGGSWTKGHGFKIHEKTKKHQRFISSNTE